MRAGGDVIHALQPFRRSITHLAPRPSMEMKGSNMDERSRGEAR
jgi:hypothetical protein